MALDITEDKRTTMNDTVEELESELQEVLLNIDNIAQRVVEKEMDAYEGFMESEKYKNRVVEIGYALKEKGIDISKRVTKYMLQYDIYN